MKKGIIKVVALILTLSFMAITVFSGCDDGKTENSVTESVVEESKLKDKYEYVELDKDKVYFADIDIKDYGKIIVKLDQKAAPISCANFVALADMGFYDGLKFHRIIEGFMMQGGNAEGTDKEGIAQTIKGEFSANGVENPLLHTRGAISMARANDMDSASSQFFIVHETSPHLDGKYACFGYVTDGMDVVDEICKTAEPTDDNGSIEESKQPVINSIRIRT